MDVTKVVVALIGLLSTIVTVFLAPYLKAKLDVEKLNKLGELSKRFVLAAEQLIGKGEGEKKKAQVQDWLKEKGYDVSLDEVDSAIEAAVKEMNIAMGASQK
jgi:LL-H family phage holin